MKTNRATTLRLFSRITESLAPCFLPSVKYWVISSNHRSSRGVVIFSNNTTESASRETSACLSCVVSLILLSVCHRCYQQKKTCHRTDNRNLPPRLCVSLSAVRSAVIWSVAASIINTWTGSSQSLTEAGHHTADMKLSVCTLLMVSITFMNNVIWTLIADDEKWIIKMVFMNISWYRGSMR